MPRSLRIAVLVKQIPKFEQMTLGADGRLVRDGLPLDLNAYCRRAVAQAVELVSARGGSVTVLTLGPSSAEDSLREALAWGLERGVRIEAVHVCDPAFAGSDTLATARAMVATLEREGPFDLILSGRNSVDADTGQVPPEVAELAGMPLVAGARVLTVGDDVIEARCETDDGWVELSCSMPAVVSCAERLCDPAKVDPEGRARVPAKHLRRLSAADLGPGPWGQAASPTRVGAIRSLDIARDRLLVSGGVAEQVAAAVAALAARGALVAPPESLPPMTPGPFPDRVGPGADEVVVLVEPDREAMTRELLGGAATLADQLDGFVTAIGLGLAPTAIDDLARHGADRVVVVDGLDPDAAELDVADAVGAVLVGRPPWGLLAPSTMWGREVAGRVAARLGAGLTGDAVELDVDDGRLVAWKPAFGGAVVAAIMASSPTQAATVRAGVLDALAARWVGPPVVERHRHQPSGRVKVLGRTRDDDLEVLAHAEVVIGVGQGVEPDRYPELEPLRRLLGAEIGATRKVTDQGWLPRARQIGITGRSIRPRLFVSIGASGKFNHTVGVRGAGTVLGVNADPDAPLWGWCDIGIVGEWDLVVPSLTDALASELSRS